MSWIKVETHTPEKPEVFAIAEKLGISSDDAFGKCFRVWAWFDAHTTNGKTNGSGVSASLLNRVAGVSGFAESMVSVGWLVDGEHGLTVDKFDRHNGETAKQRGLTAKRVAKFALKTNDETNGSGVTSPLPREEKIREEINPSLFARFWDAYPKKKAKGDAEKAWKKIKSPSETLGLILSSLNSQIRSQDWIKENGKYIPYPATYLNDRRWEDGGLSSTETAIISPAEKLAAWQWKMSGLPPEEFRYQPS